jgi:Fic family protein
MEPLLPGSGRSRLAELSVEIFKKSGELKASLPSKGVRAEVAKLVREMNSYYSNLIEGHKTLPRDIERALREDFSNKEEDRRNQQLSVAHIEAEKAMARRLAEQPGTNVFAPEFICWLHQEFYSHIPEAQWFTTSKSGIRHPLEPGRLRSYHVDVGRHTPPDHTALPAFMERFESAYGSSKILATNGIIALAAAHHRLAWIHPFGDGNGRVARLQSQAAMIRAGLDGEGLWTLSRGLARKKSVYFKHLQEADQGRKNDFDGRGNLSDGALASFCIFFLEQILDQIDFMIGIIEPFKLQERIANYFRFIRMDLDPKTRELFTKLIQELSIKGEIPRGAVPEVLGLKQTMSREIVRKALDENLVYSDSEKRPLKIAFPSKVVEYYLPSLFTDLPVDSD